MGVVCPMELYFVLWSGGQRSTYHSFHSAFHLVLHCGENTPVWAPATERDLELWV